MKKITVIVALVSSLILLVGCTDQSNQTKKDSEQLQNSQKTEKAAAEKAAAEKAAAEKAAAEKADNLILKKRYKSTNGDTLIFMSNPIGEADGVYRIDIMSGNGMAKMGMFRAYKQQGNIIYEAPEAIPAASIEEGEKVAEFTIGGGYNISIEPETGDVIVGGMRFIPTE